YPKGDGTNGIHAYKENALKLLKVAKEGLNPFSKYNPSKPEGVDLLEINETLIQQEQAGLKNMAGACFVLVAGGVGDRLGYKGVKVDIPLDLITMRSYLQLYAEKILAWQKTTNKINNTKVVLPFVIMVSEDTEAGTVELLKANKNFGMAEGQIVLLKQNKVPSIHDNEASFLFNPETGLLETKPYGHGEIHALLRDSGLKAKWKSESRKSIIYFQDTNGQSINAMAPALGVHVEQKASFTSITSDRAPGEAAGGVTKLVNKEDPTDMITANVEYNYLEPLLAPFGGDVADKQPGKNGSLKSMLPGNLNILIEEIDAGCRAEDISNGRVKEMMNPKYKEGTNREVFKKPTRVETNMQDVVWDFTEKDRKRIIYVNFDRVLTFSPDKNEPNEAWKNVKAKKPADNAATAESDYYEFNRQVFRYAGMKVAKAEKGTVMETVYEEKEIGIPFLYGPMISCDANFAVSMDEVTKKINGGEITKRGVLSLEGDIYLDDVFVDGALVVKAIEGAKVIIVGAKIKNASWSIRKLKDNDEDKKLPQAITMRGYTLDKHETKILNITEPGEYIVTMNDAGEWIFNRQK
ncbi:MAG: UTP--glucose-1-phosphate uridylyltransferase, partial [Candidatus Margulisbacteria bacterium]|nr:UTP--glucose-1-phosphate uridylyltransferase [Candidatus Margulisiibacteriota bacterium]